LSKNVDERLRDLGDARLELRDAAHEVDKTSDAAVGKRQQLSKLAVVTLLSLLAAGTTIFQLVFSRKPRPPTRFVVAAPRRFSDEGLAISRDGRVLVYPGVSERGFQLIRRSLDSLEEIPIRGTEGAEHPFLSPDGHWIAYVSNESGPYEIYVRSFPDAETQWQVTNGGGVQPQWSPNGDELFYIGSDAWLMAVPVKTGQGFALGEPVALFDAHIHGGASAAPGIRAEYDVAPDAQHFLLNQNDPEWGTTPIRVVLDWFAELEEEMQEARRHDG